MCFRSVQHIVVVSTRASFIKKLLKLLKDDYDNFESIKNV